MPASTFLPFDEHNQRLQQNVFPTDWQNPIPTGAYNLVVIGAGTAGLVTVSAAAVRKAGAFGVEVPKGMTVDFAKTMARMRKLCSDISRLAPSIIFWRPL